jgi:hypothetical protein
MVVVVHIHKVQIEAALRVDRTGLNERRHRCTNEGGREAAFGLGLDGPVNLRVRALINVLYYYYYCD